MLGNEFNNNQQALSGYMKNWRYGKGGRLVVCENEFRGNEKFITLDKKSHAWISPRLTPAASIATKDRTRITENCELLSGLGQFGDQQQIDYRGLDDNNYLPFLETLYEMISAPGY